jgi:hypothetical protein
MPFIRKYSTILAVMIIGVFEVKDRQSQTGRFAALRRLQQVLGLVASGPRLCCTFVLSKDDFDLPCRLSMRGPS